MIALELLRTIQLFQELPESLQIEIAKDVQLKEFQKKDLIFRRGAPGNGLFMLFSGKLQVISTTDEGREVGIKFIEPGDFFGEIALIDGGPRSASIIAIETSTIGVLAREKALWLFQNVPQLAERIQKRLCATIRQEINHRSNLRGSKAYTRIYSVLFSNIPAQPSQANQPSTIENLPSQESIASMANVSRETVSRAIQALVKQGIINKDARRLTINDPQILVRLARGEINPEQIRIIKRPEKAT